MAADPALLRLLAWLSPGFPIGGFAHAQGLEWAVEAGDVADETALRAWIAALLDHGSLRADAILLRHAHRAPDAAALAAVADLAAAAQPGRERRSETLSLGSAFAIACAVWDGAPPSPAAPVAYPVAFGAAAARHGIGEDDAVAGFLHAMAAGLVSAAVRLVPLGQTAGLRVLAALEPAILAAASATVDATLDALGGAAFRADIAAMRHETQHTRLFRT